jgi:hypothetical protein
MAISLTGSLNVSGSNTLIGTKTVTGSVFISGSKTIVGPVVITGSLVQSGSFISYGPNIFIGNTTQTGSITIAPTSGSGAAVIVSGSATIGGTNYIDFIRVTNTASGSVNPNTTFRKNITGAIEMINSTYQNTVLSIDDSGSIVTQGNVQIQGNIIMPNRPAFRVSGAGNSIGATTVISGSNINADYSQGSGWNQSTGTFTAPIAGLYQINIVGRTYANNNSGINQIIVRKNSGGTLTTQIMIEWASNTSVNHIGGSSVTKLAVGDTIQAIVTAGTIIFDGNDNFSVAYIG